MANAEVGMVFIRHKNAPKMRPGGFCGSIQKIEKRSWLLRFWQKEPISAEELCRRAKSWNSKTLYYQWPNSAKHVTDENENEINNQIDLPCHMLACFTL